ncbi:hypothetical protein Nepgr_015048 [Nepenthes gracilis]|uniref:Uncharacterized protein n=1 Tax=Nepenthes gracilis TaxID=150966 RepID=A0AAD3SLH5_NEPGR|nr:hypothetical protein Nepgr_015048 [Nepenthes gracilis]
MVMVVVISLPLVLFCILLGVGCFFLGRYKARQEAARAQVLGTPIPPPFTVASYSSSPAPPPPPPPPPPHSKHQSSANIV